MDLFRFPLLVAHIAAGVLCLVGGTYLAIARKGTRLHRQIGTAYFVGMMVVCFSAIGLASIRWNPALLLIALFSGYMATSGYRAQVILRRGQAGRIDHVLVVSMLLAGLVMIAYGVTRGAVVLPVFGGIACALAITDLRSLLTIAGEVSLPATLPGDLLPRHQGGQPWQTKVKRRHGTMMAGSLISVWTAFLVTNVRVEPAWIVWLAPSVIGTSVLLISGRKRRIQSKSLNAGEVSLPATLPGDLLPRHQVGVSRGTGPSSSPTAPAHTSPAP